MLSVGLSVSMSDTLTGALDRAVIENTSVPPCNSQHQADWTESGVHVDQTTQSGTG